MNELRDITPMDELEAAIAELPACDFPVGHLFTPGMYVRTTTLPKDSILTSLEHKTRHPFVVLSGVVEVVSGFEKTTYTGPCAGVTEAGTKRVLYAVEETVWMTFHANPDNLEDPDEIGKRITEPFDNPLFPDKDDPRISQWKNGRHSINKTLEEKS